MASNVYTKNEILQNLASKGYFIDAYTLDTFFDKWKVEAIFEDEQGSEFFDKNALDLVLNNLFNSNDDDEEEKKEEEPQEEIRTIRPASEIIKEEPKRPIIEPKATLNDQEANNILNNISLSDGSSLASKLQNDMMNDGFIDIENIEDVKIPEFEAPTQPPFIESAKKEHKMGILEGAMLATGQEYVTEPPETQVLSPEENGDFDDISLLSESLEAQEKLREYVVSELSKKNMDLTPKNNEFKLDISERTLSMIARSMAKKIAKHVSSIYSADAKNSGQLAEIQEKNKKLEQRTRDLEDQNKKLRLLLAESNKNLNSYKPSIFGLYKKVPPTK